MKKLIVCLLLLTLLLAFSQPALAVDFYVNDADTLIAAINAANATPEVDTIILTADIVLTTVNNTNFGPNGLPSVTTTILLGGYYHSISRDPAAPDFRIFHIANTGNLSIHDLGISNGHLPAGSLDDRGGGIRNDGQLTIVNTTVTDNYAEIGGGIINYGTMGIFGSWITTNTADFGGGFISYGGSTTLFKDSVIANNTANLAAGVSNGGYTTLVHTFVTDNTATGHQAGGIENSGRATLINSTVTNNTAHINGGGLYNRGNMIVVGTTISNNTAITGIGGGIFNIRNLSIVGGVIVNNTAVDGAGAANYYPGVLNVTNTLVAGNETDGLANMSELNVNQSTIINNIGNAGGGIDNNGTLRVTNSTIADNYATSFGGGIYNNVYGAATITNSTISGNEGQFDGGGVINSLGTVTLENTTVVNNTSYDAGGVGFVPFVNRTIVANNTATTYNPNCNAIFSTLGSLSNTGDCIGFGAITPGTDFSAILADNGGPTQTHALIDTGANPAIDPGVGGTLTDQRGVPIQGSSRDIGAYEYGANPILPTVSFVGTGATYDETAGTITIELNISGAANFAQEVNVYVADVLGLFVTPGEDYVYEPLIGVNVDCSVEDCAGGVTRTITLTILHDDVSPEQDETIPLELVASYGFANIGSNTYTVTIQDVPPPVIPTTTPVATTVVVANDSQATPAPEVSVFDPAVSKIGFLLPGQVGVTGEQIEWVITVSNPGTVPGANVVVTDTLRPELRVDHATTDKGNVSINGQTVTFTLGTLNPGESVQMSIFTTVIRGGLQVDNTAIVSADNMANSKTVTAQVVTALPNTGESPLSQWRRLPWLIIALLAGISYISRR